MIIFPIMAAIFYGTQFVPQKLAGEIKAECYNLSMILGSTIGSIVAFFICSFIIGFDELHLIPFLFSFSGGVIWSLANRFTLIGIENIGMAKSAVILNVVSVISFIFGIIFFAEIPHIFRYFGVPILILGAIIISFLTENHQKINKKGVTSVFLATIFISINNVLTTEAIISITHPKISFFMAVMFMSFGAVCGALLFNINPSKLREWKEQTKKTHLFALGAGFIWLCGFEITSFTLAEFGLTFGVPIIQSVMILVSALWGILYFKEIEGKNKLILYVLGAAITIFGLILFIF
ncbi:MAG: GRP family sugar transporter [Promethearchaeota archaeon]